MRNNTNKTLTPALMKLFFFFCSVCFGALYYAIDEWEVIKQMLHAGILQKDEKWKIWFLFDIGSRKKCWGRDVLIRALDKTLGFFIHIFLSSCVRDIRLIIELRLKQEQSVIGFMSPWSLIKLLLISYSNRELSICVISEVSKTVVIH